MKFLECKLFNETRLGHLNSSSSFKAEDCVLPININRSFCNLLLSYFTAVCRLVFETLLDVFVLIVGGGGASADISDFKFMHRK